ncbi:MAG: EamA family transporter [Actinomycetota bacterium]|jgi:inner membrane transporter RhtA|nr:EamA family transporter [Actinomycetota bacterium]
MTPPQHTLPEHRVPAEAFFVLGAVSQYLGAAVAVGLFDELRPGTVALVRVLTAGLVVVAWRRSWKRRWTGAELRLAAAFGIALASMNLSIYVAFDQLPLGNAVAIEFMGPIAVAAVGSRTVRAGGGLVLAAAGVLVLAGVQAEGTLRGVAFALLAGIFWAGYIVLGHRVASQGSAIDGLGVGMLIGAVVISPFGATGLTPTIDRPTLLALALLTGVLSSVFPYAIDQVVMRRITRARFAFLQSLLPVTAAVVGFVTLDQTPTGRELLGVGLVITAILIRGADAPGTTETQ